MRTLEEIRTDILALEKETEGCSAKYWASAGARKSGSGRQDEGYDC